jgi:hypothetical protein
MWGEFYRVLHEEAERLRRIIAEQKGDAGTTDD